MRIIAGIAKGRRLRSLGGDTRPMTDRAREGIFSSLGPAVVDAAVADLYAGTGSMGLEALSRGAASAVFVERARRALGVLRRNVETAGLGGEVVAADVAAFLRGSERTFDLVFVDPPYVLSLASVRTILDEVVPRLGEHAIVVVHRRAGESPGPPEGLAVVDRRRYGDSEITRMMKETP
jgi:16S rRNA (guanine966-N2)-methyltransferase